LLLQAVQPAGDVHADAETDDAHEDQECSGEPRTDHCDEGTKSEEGDGDVQEVGFLFRHLFHLDVDALRTVAPDECCGVLLVHRKG
jgi:hypothetical protein